MSKQVFVRGDWRDHLPPKDTTLIVADPPYSTHEIDDLIEMALGRDLPTCMFMYPLDVCGLKHKPEQLCHWVKPVSTKNTVKRYSNFVEVIAMWNVTFYEKLHWSNRTGVFVDELYRNDDHVWKKPESLIERLIRNHYCGKGTVYDPCAGSRTVETVCKRLDIDSYSVEIDPKVQ